MNDDKKRYAMYSEKATQSGLGTVIWRRPDGSEVECSLVVDTPTGERIGWEDKVMLGEVTEYVRQGQPKSGIHAQNLYIPHDPDYRRRGFRR